MNIKSYACSSLVQLISILRLFQNTALYLIMKDENQLSQEIFQHESYRSSIVTNI